MEIGREVAISYTISRDVAAVPLQPTPQLLLVQQPRIAQHWPLQSRAAPSPDANDCSP